VILDYKKAETNKHVDNRSDSGL